jgi:hypothetical protein
MRHAYFCMLLPPSHASPLVNRYAWGVKYVVLQGGPRPAIDEEFLDNHVKHVFTVGNYRVFRVKYNSEPY